MAYRDFTTTTIWKRGFELLQFIYMITRQFPPEEKYILVSDMRRAANSVIHNYAEGYGRFESKNKTRFYKISRGSAYEIISQTHASHVLGYISIQDKEHVLTESRDIINEEDQLILSIESRKQP